MAELKEPISFFELIKDYRRIEIPLIQRDYAQGRESQKDVREDFLGVLYGALSRPLGDPLLPLNLDFVYGSIKPGTIKEKRFFPLDGQQRLTTLFLLHWYLAWRDARVADYRKDLWDGEHSRFTYSVRPSSSEFFDALIQFDPTDVVDNVSSVRRMLEDQPWFFLNWRLDPTIQAALTMLDAIHTRFQKSAGLYARLVDEAPRVITFHLLPLEHFGLTDDLYIKMNARGKPLTAFETFKARFEELLKDLFPVGTRRIEETDVPVPTFFERRMDTQWTDFFWSHQHPTFDVAALHLIWTVIRISLEPTSTSFVHATSELGEKSLAAGYALFNDRGWLTASFADHLMDVLEAWSAGGEKLTAQLPQPNYFDEAAFFERAIASPWSLTYLELTQFAALAFYLTRFRGVVEKNALQEWMRIVTNLAVNSDIERPEEFGRSLAGLQKLISEGDHILRRFTEDGLAVSGFSPQQVREEVLKAQLILSRSGWRERIEAAEAHGYFVGQIEFLLKFSGVLDRWLQGKSIAWNDDEDTRLQARFSDYFDRASAVFGGHGVNNFGYNRWERALLTKGDYLLERGINRSFLSNAERDASWRRLLRGSLKWDQATEEKRGFVRELLDDIDVELGVAQSLDAVIAKTNVTESWRRVVIERPAIIDYCQGRNIRWHETGNIYLMRKAQMNGDHAELFTYYLFVGLLSEKHRRGELAPFGIPTYRIVAAEAETPHVHFSWIWGSDTIKVLILNHDERYQIQVENYGGPLPQELRDRLQRNGKFSSPGDNGIFFHEVERTAIESALDQIVSVARSLMAQSPNA